MILGIGARDFADPSKEVDIGEKAGLFVRAHVHGHVIHVAVKLLRCHGLKQMNDFLSLLLGALVEPAVWRRQDPALGSQGVVKSHSLLVDFEGPVDAH